MIGRKIPNIKFENYGNMDTTRGMKQEPSQPNNSNNHSFSSKMSIKEYFQGSSSSAAAPAPAARFARKVMPTLRDSSLPGRISESKVDSKVDYHSVNEKEESLDSHRSVTLSTSQMQVLEAIAGGKSVFFTGAAGCGKSYILQILQELFTLSGQRGKIAFTAPTGVAACNVGGRTINSWSGIGIGEGDIDQIIKKAIKSKEVKERWKTTSILVIDEISMLSGHIFDMLSTIGKQVRSNNLPFGGMQIVLCGDFFQLPPVGLNRKDQKVQKSFCFESQTWKEIFGDFTMNSNIIPSINTISTGISTNSQSTSNSTSTNPRSSSVMSNASNVSRNQYDDLKGEMIVLSRVFRQKDDTFLQILNEVRLSKLKPNTINILTQKSAQSIHIPQTNIHPEDMIIQHTRLFSVNTGVDNFNTRELEKLQPSSSTPINSVDAAKTVLISSKTKNNKKTMDDDDDNDDDNDKNLESPFYRYEAYDVGEKTTLEQLLQGVKAPKCLDLKIGAQVMLLKNIDILSGLVNGARGIVTKFVQRDDSSVDGMGKTPDGTVEILPEVMFNIVINNKKSTVTRVIEREKWEITEREREVVSRVQIPLMLAWAISIHKAQGMTIPLLDLSFNGIFEYGQAYVALSRATDLEGLILRNFNPSSIKTNQKVVDFYQAISFDIRKQNDRETNTKEKSGDLNSGLVTTSYGELLRIFSKILSLRMDDSGALHTKTEWRNNNIPLVKSIVDKESNSNEMNQIVSSNNSSSSSSSNGSRLLRKLIYNEFNGFENENNGIEEKFRSVLTSDIMTEKDRIHGYVCNYDCGYSPSSLLKRKYSNDSSSTFPLYLNSNNSNNSNSSIQRQSQIQSVSSCTPTSPLPPPPPPPSSSSSSSTSKSTNPFCKYSYTETNDYNNCNYNNNDYYESEVQPFLKIPRNQSMTTNDDGQNQDHDMNSASTNNLPSISSINTGITEEGRRQMEANRLAAMAKLEAKRQRELNKCK